MDDEEITRLQVGSHNIGISGFAAVIEEIGPALAKATDQEIGEQIVSRLSGKNYIPEKARDEYARALAREYRRRMGQEVSPAEEAPLTIRVLGQGCANCRALTDLVRQVLTEKNLPADLDHITDIREIARYGVMGTPALVINGKIVSAGKVPTKNQVLEWLQKGRLA
jgi:small redox-active disulfide protein 2